MLSNGSYRHAPEWYRNFRYTAEADRGLDCEEDLAAPGVLEFDLSARTAIWIASASSPGEALGEGVSAEAFLLRSAERERARRSRFATPLDRAADSYLVTRGRGRTV